MRILKTNPVLTIFNSYLVDSPQPSSISYLYNFGSLLGLSLVVQIITGIFLAMHFAGTAELAFSSAEHGFNYNIKYAEKGDSVNYVSMSNSSSDLNTKIISD